MSYKIIPRNTNNDQCLESGFSTFGHSDESINSSYKTWFPEDKFNKLLLDLEILGVIKVAWITKETRRIEIVVIKEEVDIVDEQNQEMMEKDYEASFPGFEK
ncbi:MAG: hypothetical protein ACE5RL_04950 [Nitrosarchaeum sp.]